VTRRHDIEADCYGSQPTKQPEGKRSRRIRHNRDVLYHGPLRIGSNVTQETPRDGALYRTTHYHSVIRQEHDGVTYIWRCLPCGVDADYLAEVVRTPEGAIRCHVYRQIEMREPWRGEPRTVANRVVRFAPDLTIRAVTVEQERAHFTEHDTITAYLTPLAPPIVAPIRPLWQEDGQ